MKIRTSELTGAALDWAVAKAIGEYKPMAVPHYSTDWALGGPIIEREKISLLALNKSVRRVVKSLPFLYKAKIDSSL